MAINTVDSVSTPPRPLPNSNMGAVAPQTQETTQSRDAIQPVQALAPTQKTADATDPAAEKENFESLKFAVDKTQQFVNMSTNDVLFSLDTETGRMIVKVIERSSKEVIREIPSKEMLEIAQTLERLQGLLIKQKA